MSLGLVHTLHSCQSWRWCKGIRPRRSVLMQSYDAAEGEALAFKYEKLNWRIISKPGGATVKPDEFYTLYG